MWIFASIVLCLAVVGPYFRKMLLILSAAVIVIIAIIAINDSSRRASSETAAASQSVSPPMPPPPPPREIPVRQIEVGNIWSNFGSNYQALNRIDQVSARIYNNAPDDALDTVEYQLLIEDCDGKRCVTVDDEKGSFYLPIPHGQARDTGFALKGAGFGSIAILGRPRIKVLITKAIAAK